MDYLFLLTLPAFLVFLFVFWRKLKDDYLSKEIFSTGMYVAVGGILGGTLSYYFFPNAGFFFKLIGATLGVLLGIKKYKLRFYEVLETHVVSTISYFFVYSVGVNIFSFSLNTLYTSIGLLVLMGIYSYLDKQYKNFSWYKSGRAGFSGLTVGALSLLARATAILLLQSTFDKPQSADAIVSGILSFALFLLVFNLSRSEI